MSNDTEAVATTAPPLYTHPTLRTTTQEELAGRLEAIRARRLVAAIEFKSAEANRLAREHATLGAKWTALASKLSKHEYAIREQIEKFEKELNQLIQLNNQMATLEIDH